MQPKPQAPKADPVKVDLAVAHVAGNSPWTWTFSANDSVVAHGSAVDQDKAFLAARTAYQEWLKHQP